MKIGVLGAGGRLGSEFLKLTQVAVAPRRNEGFDSLSAMDVILEIASPDAGVALIQRLTDLKKFPALVVGSTGWNTEQLKAQIAYSHHAPVVFASNFSAAVTVLRVALSRVAPVLDRLGYQISIEETHHVHKKDAPSGTALSLRDAMGKLTSKVPIESKREGDVIGLHRVILETPLEALAFEHEAKSRVVFAQGALIACEWAASKTRQSGIYSMTDVLGL